MGPFSTISRFCIGKSGKIPNFGSPKLSRAWCTGPPDGLKWPIYGFLEDFMNIYNRKEGILKISIFWVFMAIFTPKFPDNSQNGLFLAGKMAIKTQKIEIFKIPSL